MTIRAQCFYHPPLAKRRVDKLSAKPEPHRQQRDGARVNNGRSRFADAVGVGKRVFS